MGIDRWATDHLVDLVRDAPGVVDALKVLTSLGKPEPLMALAAVGAVYLIVQRHVWPAAFLLVTSPLGWLIDVGLKDLIDRDRPIIAEPIASGSGHSFPSGHAMVATVVYGALLVAVPALRRPMIVRGAAVVVAVVAFTRVALGVHWLSDVVGGIVLGGIWLVVATTAFGANLSPWRRPTPARSSESGRSASPSPRPPRS